MSGMITSEVSVNCKAMQILLVDDHPIIRHGLRLMIEREPDLSVCGEAGGTAQAIRQCLDYQPDVVVSDISLDDGSGIQLVEELIALDDTLKVLMCSMHEERLFAERAIRAGARGFVSKAVAVEELVNAIRRVAAGRIHLSRQMTDRMLTRRLVSGDVRGRSVVETLSDRELQVFEQIGNGVTTRRIAGELHLSPKTVETYRENIKHKLNLDNAAELTQHAVQWVLEQSRAVV
jgi:DNA-binding NarL/FixJ family response regulator